MVFVAATAATCGVGAEAVEGVETTEAVIEAGTAAGKAAKAAADVAKAAKAAKDAAEVGTTVKKGYTVAEALDAVQAVGGVLSLSANWAQNGIDNNAPLQLLQCYTGVYGSVEAQMAVNISVLASSDPPCTDPSLYLLGVAGGATGSKTKIGKRNLTDKEMLAMQHTGTVANVTYLASTGSTNPADYINAIANSYGSGGKFPEIPSHLFIHCIDTHLLLFIFLLSVRVIFWSLFCFGLMIP